MAPPFSTTANRYTSGCDKPHSLLITSPTRGSSQSESAKDSRHYAHPRKKQNPNSFLGEYTLLCPFVLDSSPSAPNPLRPVLKPSHESAHVHRVVHAFALRRGSDLPPTSRDTGFAETPETALSAVSAAFHDDRWRHSFPSIERGKTPRWLASSRTNYAKTVGAKRYHSC